MRIAVGSAKGSPGATSFALALAVVWPRPVVLVEADPAGGDLGGRFGVPDHPGLAGLVVAARRDEPAQVWSSHTQRLVVGADVVIGPASGRQAHQAVSRLAEHLPPTMETDLIVDVGRLGETSPAWSLALSCDVLLLVSATDVVSLDHTAALSSRLRDETRMWVVLVGGHRFRPTEVADVLGVPVLVSVPTDRRTAAVLSGSARPGRDWTRFGVPAAARTAAVQLIPDVPPSTPRRAARPHAPALTTRGGRQ